MSEFAGSLTANLRSEKFQRRLRIVFIYMTGQGLVQILNLSIGFLLLRWLNVENYAQFSVAFGFQTTLGVLSDLGFSGTIIALVGSRGNDPDVIGSYVRSGRHIRNLMLVCLTPAAAIVYVVIARRHHWEMLSSALLFASIVASIYFTGMVSYYGAPLLIRGRLSHYYRHQLVGAAVRLGGCGILYLSGALSAWTTSWTNALGFLLIGWLNSRESRPFAKLPVRHISEVTRQMARYVAPNLPGVIFFALQGQISVFLISLFGHTRSIAEVGALSRLGQIFILLTAFNGTVMEPFLARLPEERVLQRFLAVFTTALLICVLVCSAGFFAPRFFLLLLGARYSSLDRETGWIVLSGCTSYLTSVLYTLCFARRWVYWTTTWTSIGVILATQIAFLSFIKVDSTMHVIYFSAACSAAYMLSGFFNSIYGFLRGPRIEISGSVPIEHGVEETIGD